MNYVARQEDRRLRLLLGMFPAVVVVGPPQCGKSTLARHAPATRWKMPID
jgi:hypothetical protein